ncbi:MAG: hypothetical protein JSR37_00315 [Verrucomicrobia bacterium]|nr:hypothetical protein [Verrucomicrobiota bacterium]MBS0638104.1 hypothetical protein [Verrucomicrobiota bacterium]
MEELLIKYRKWAHGIVPRPIKLQIPGWSGKCPVHMGAAAIQPWECLPFIEASTYGLELCYSFEGEVRVSNHDNKIVFEGDTEIDDPDPPYTKIPLFSSFSPHFFGHTSCLDIQVPPGYVLRTEPHPSFYTDATGQVPCCLPGHLQTSWWPMIFFVVFKTPIPGQTIVFRKGEPYGQVLVVPHKLRHKIEEMSSSEQQDRHTLSILIRKHSKKILEESGTKDQTDGVFDYKYKILSTINAKKGPAAVREYIYSL